MPRLNLSASSYVVLGLLDRHGPTTPYQLERFIGASIGYFWPFPRSQLYTEATRLTRHHLVAERREHSGRRRRVLDITPDGRAELAQWLSTSTDAPTEIRDEGLLRLFLAGGDSLAEDVRRLAGAQARAHRDRLADYDALVARDALVPGSPQRAALELGLRLERMMIEYWDEVQDSPPGG